MGLTRLFVRRPSLVVVVLALVALAGTLAFRTIVQQNFPNIDFPVVQVHLSYPGASTTEIRDAIVKPVEDAIAGAPDLDHLNTTIQQGQATITATFTLDSNQTTDQVEVQNRLQSTRAVLPTDLSPPSVRTFDPGEATVATLVVTSPTLDAPDLSSLVTNEIVPDLEQIDGIANVNAGGTVTPAIEVEVDPNKIAASNFTLGDVVSAISSNNVRAPGGIAYGAARETSIDVRGDVTTPQSVASLPLVGAANGSTGGAVLTGPQGGTGLLSPGTGASGGSAATSFATAGGAASSALAGPSSGNGATAGLNPFSVATRALRIADVAHVYAGSERKRQFGYVGGIPAITLGVQKATGASEIAASQHLLAALPTIRKKYPQVVFAVLNVQADFTQQQLDAVYHSLAEGILFTGIVMLFFLRSWRNAIVVLVAIPTSLLVTLFVMRMANFTIDTISLLAMTLLIGILVDDSIVVLENTERHYEDGESAQTAALLGRSEIGAAALVITLVDVVVFLPISFLPGTVGRFLSEFGLVVVVATLTSLAVSFTITPALAGNWSLKSTWKPWPPIVWFGVAFERVRTFYVTRPLVWALDHPWIVALGAFAATAGALALVPLGVVGFEFIPAVDRGQIFVQINYPSGSPLTTTNRTVADLSARFARLPDVKSVTGTAGISQGPGGGVAIGSGGQITVFLVDKPKHDSAYWARRLGSIAAKAFPAAGTVAIPATGTGGGNAQPIDYVISSLDDLPDPYAAEVLATLAATPGVVHANSSVQKLVPQVDVVFDRERARALDVDIATAANAVRAAFGGTQAAQFENARGIEYVQVTYPERAQTSVAQIAGIAFRTRTGRLAHVGDVARLVNDPNSPLMSRVNRLTVVHVSANVAPGAVLSNVQRAFKKGLLALHLPAGVTIAPNAGGQQQNLADTVRGLGYALALAGALVFLLMVALYDSYRMPFIIMFAVPVASIGALGALALTHETLNLFSLIGTVMLIGLVSKNGILLVDFANHRIRAGVDRRAAIVESARERFRPIVMTTVSMIAGMSPIALALDPGAGVRQALGTVVIGGLTSSLLLTLLLVPVAFVWFAPRYPHRDAPLERADLPVLVADPTGASRG